MGSLNSIRCAIGTRTNHRKINVNTSFGVIEKNAAYFPPVRIQFDTFHTFYRMILRKRNTYPLFDDSLYGLFTLFSWKREALDDTTILKSMHFPPTE